MLQPGEETVAGRTLTGSGTLAANTLSDWAMPQADEGTVTGRTLTVSTALSAKERFNGAMPQPDGKTVSGRMLAVSTALSANGRARPRAVLSVIQCFLVAVWVPAGLAQDGPALPESSLTMDRLVDGLADGSVTLDSLRRKGLQVFTTPFNTFDGYGDGPYAGETPTTSFGHRPTLQGNGTTLRVNGLDAQSCNECHSFVKRSTRPPALGIGGVGGIVQNAIIMPSLIDVADSADTRVNYTSGYEPDLPVSPDGTADFDGRYANPPFLFGGGGVELLAKEMTVDLQRALAAARAAEAGAITRLITHGVDFGHIETVAGGGVALHVEGIGFEDNAGRRPEDVLVVRPFGRKGENFSMRDFDRGAMQFHFGMQPVEVVGPDEDADGDGVVNEVTEVEMSALHVFDVTNPAPIVERLGLEDYAGFLHFVGSGCAECHVPVLQTRSRHLPLSFPEVPENPWHNAYMEVDLVEVGFEPVPGEDGVFVPLFADLKRHDMGEGLRESFSRGEIANEEFTTARLWGVADTAPYLHDGRATTLTEAIDAHGGEAQASRDAFAALSDKQRAQLLAFLGRLRTPDNPNEELIDPQEPDPPAAPVAREGASGFLTNR